MHARDDFGGIFKGCAIGIGLLLILGGAGVLAVYYAAGGPLRAYEAQLREELPRAHAEFVASGAIPPALRDDYARMVEAAMREEANVVVVAISSGLLHQTLEDGEVDEVEARLVQSWNAFLERNPAPGIAEAFQFVKDNPHLKEILERIDPSLRTPEPAS